VIAELLEKEAVPAKTLHQRYGSLLELVRTLIGVVPNCDAYLEIWPTAFRTYNVLVPNLLNLPFLVWGMGGAPRAAVGLGMYVASRAAGCPYCSAHACSFALRRGASAEQVAAAIDEDERLDASKRAVVRVARSLGRAEAKLADADRMELVRQFGAAGAEWIVLAIALMGWLNKAMNGLGIPLEPKTAAEVNALIAPSGWTPGKLLKEPAGSSEPPGADSLRTKLGVIRHAPSAISLDKAWTAGVPNKPEAIARYLREQTGHDFPILSRIRHRRAVRAIATAIRDNFVAANSIIGLEHKLAAGLVYVEAVGSESLAADLRAVGAKPLDDSPIAALARGLASSPTVIDDSVMDVCRSLPPAAIVEVVTFIALLQLLHRLHGFYAETGRN
jgi:hypothetical protein